MVFNSLGSNYSKEFLKASRRYLFHRPASSLDSLTSKLQKSYPSFMPVYFHQGRQALNFALKSFNLSSGDEVLTQALTCWAVEQGIRASGLKPVFVDLGPDQLNLSLETLTQAFNQASRPKVILLQHTLGYPPADLDEIHEFAHTHKLLILHDLAHAFGATPSHRPLGLNADAVILSFGRDKIIDALSGGVALLPESAQPEYQSLPSGIVTKDLLYPSLTAIIRNHYLKFSLGKALHFFAKKTKLLTSPINSPSGDFHSLASSYQHLALHSFSLLQKDLKHRRLLATTYQQHLNSSFRPSPLPLTQSTCLRYPILVKDRNNLIKKLIRHGFYLSDTWYKSPVDSGSLKVKSLYRPGSCKNAEFVADHIFNLPTHKKVSLKTAQQLTSLINHYAQPINSN